MYSRLLATTNNKSFFLFGPRGTGKTTWVKSVFKDALYVDLLESETFLTLSANPGRLERMIPPKYNGWIVIDEVQKVPEILNEVHRLIEERKLKFILTGSSARKIRRKGVNLLAGRALTNSMHTLSAVELGKDFNLKHSVLFGQLPCAYTEKDPGRYLSSYVKTYLQEEVLQEGLTRNLGAFARFLEAASFSQGSVLNISNVSRDCGVERKIVENYFTILEDLLIAYKVPVFTKKAKRRIVSHPKFFLFDAGVYRAIRPKGPLDMPEEIDGCALETLLFQELKTLNDSLNLGYDIFYWRTSNDVEVDFVLYGNKGILAFEIKRAGRYNESMLKGLKAFRKDYPSAKCYLIYGGDRRFYEDNVEIIPAGLAFPSLQTLLSI